MRIKSFKASLGRSDSISFARCWMEYAEGLSGPVERPQPRKEIDIVWWLVRCDMRGVKVVEEPPQKWRNISVGE